MQASAQSAVVGSRRFKVTAESDVETAPNGPSGCLAEGLLSPPLHCHQLATLTSLICGHFGDTQSKEKYAVTAHFCRTAIFSGGVAIGGDYWLVNRLFAPHTTPFAIICHVTNLRVAKNGRSHSGVFHSAHYNSAEFYRLSRTSSNISHQCHNCVLKNLP